ncbi:MAG: hypothetical protein ACOH5I_25070 [Oligoflexus sp.]
MRNLIILLMILSPSLISCSKKKSGDVNHNDTNHENDHPNDQNADQDPEPGNEPGENTETPISPEDSEVPGKTSPFLSAFDVEKMEWTIQLSIPDDPDFASIRYVSHGQNLTDCNSGQVVEGNTLTTRGGQFQFFVCDESGNRSEISEIIAPYIQGREGQAELLSPVFFEERYVQTLRMLEGVRRAFIFDLWKNEEREIDLGLQAGGAASQGHMTEEYIYTVARQSSNNARNIFMTKLGETSAQKITNIIDNRLGILSFHVTDSGDIVYRADADTPGNFEIYAVDGNGSNLRKLSPELPEGRIVLNPVVNDEYVVYRSNIQDSNKFELFMSKLDGSLIGEKISGNLAGSTGSVVITKDNQVVFTANQLSTDNRSVLSTSLECCGEITNLTSSITANFFSTFPALSLDEKTVFFPAMNTQTNKFELYQAEIGKSDSVTKLAGNLPAGAQTGGSILQQNQDIVIFAAEKNAAGTMEVFAKDLSQGIITRISKPIPEQPARIRRLSSGDNKFCYTQVTTEPAIYCGDRSQTFMTRVGQEGRAIDPLFLKLTANGEVLFFQMEDANGELQLHMSHFPFENIYQLTTQAADQSTDVIYFVDESPKGTNIVFHRKLND